MIYSRACFANGCWAYLRCWNIWRHTTDTDVNFISLYLLIGKVSFLNVICPCVRFTCKDLDVKQTSDETMSNTHDRPWLATSVQSSNQVDIAWLVCTILVSQVDCASMCGCAKKAISHVWSLRQITAMNKKILKSCPFWS